MATYASYKSVAADQIPAGGITAAKISNDARHCYCTKWFYGDPDRCSPGCCCLWTVPTGVRRLFWEAWGAGGNGHGACSCDRCHHYAGAGGGYYNSKMISTAAGCQYTVCAAGVYRCLSIECVGCKGCDSYVNGFNLSNFCAIGGDTGRAETSWANPCFSYWSCCVAPVANGGDFGMGNHIGSWSGPFNCHCHCLTTMPTAAPFMGGQVEQPINVCWMRCGCWTVPFGHGAQGAMSSYCGSSCCGQGGTGGAGVVKVTYT
jgi:hypothetical protein